VPVFRCIGSCCKGEIRAHDTSRPDYSRLNRVGSARGDHYDQGLKAVNHAVDISDTSDIALSQQRLRNIEGLLIIFSSNLTTEYPVCYIPRYRFLKERSKVKYNMQQNLKQVLQDLRNCCSPHEHFVLASSQWDGTPSLAAS